jgi:hypothetical protein
VEKCSVQVAGNTNTHINSRNAYFRVGRSKQRKRKRVGKISASFWTLPCLSLLRARALSFFSLSRLCFLAFSPLLSAPRALSLSTTPITNTPVRYRAREDEEAPSWRHICHALASPATFDGRCPRAADVLCRGASALERCLLVMEIVNKEVRY